MALHSFFDTEKLKTWLKRYPALVAAKRRFSSMKFDRELRGRTIVDIVNTFPMFKPHSAGTYKEIAALTMLSINQTVPNLLRLAETINTIDTSLRPIRSIADSEEKLRSAQAIKKCFDQYGSDKGAHDYHFLYGPILNDRKVSAILEIGLGTNNTDVVSNMGRRGKPGASLRAFRDYTGANIYGADIDKRVLFQEAGIETFYVDQTDASTFQSLGNNIPSAFDLIIDDGLHSINANLATLNFGITRLREGGWLVIEDIGRSALPLWELVSHMLPQTLECNLLENIRGTIIFTVRQIAKK